MCGDISNSTDRRGTGPRFSLPSSQNGPLGEVVEREAAPEAAALDASLVPAHIAPMCNATHRAGIGRISVPGSDRARVTPIRLISAEDFRDAFVRFAFSGFICRRGGF